ncbi:MAG: hypothetical protein ACOCZK_01310 [Planctomycetota bacterium]
MDQTVRIAATVNVAYGDHPARRLDVFAPESAEQKPAVLCFAGGRWEHDGRLAMRPLALSLAEQGFPAVAVGVRTLEQAGGGTNLLRDAAAACRAALDEASILGAHHRVVHLLGSGTGSLTALLVARELLATGTIGVRSVICCGPLPTSRPWSGCDPVLAERLTVFAGDDPSSRDPLSADPTGLPPVCSIRASASTCLPEATLTAFHERLRSVGQSECIHVLDGLPHRFAESPHAPASVPAIAQVLAWLRAPDHD